MEHDYAITGNTAQTNDGGGIFDAGGAIYSGTLVNAIAPPTAGANVFGNTPNDIVFYGYEPGQCR